MESRTVDLLLLCERDTRLVRAATTNGGEWAGPCPFCGGEDRFRVQPHRTGGGRWYCRGCGEGKWHDAIEYVRRRDRVGFVEACRRLDTPVPSRPAPSDAPRLPAVVREPSADWRAAAEQLVAASEAALWQPEGEPARAWLYDRGLHPPTLRRARLGYNPTDLTTPGSAWGLDRDRVWVPAGVVIPVVFDAALWRVKIRRLDPPAGREKYISLPGGDATTPWGLDAVQPGRPVLLVEGELDALAVSQVAGDLAAAVGLGGTRGGRRGEWLLHLRRGAPSVVSLDADAEGEAAAAEWVTRLPGAPHWPPTLKDPADMLRRGHDVRGWVTAGLQAAGAPLPDDLPATCALCPAPVHRYTPAGMPLCELCHINARALDIAA